MSQNVNRSRVYAEAAHFKGTTHAKQVERLGHRMASMLDIMMGAARWYHTRALAGSARIEKALADDGEAKRDQLATIEKLLALAVHPNTPPEEAQSARAKANSMLRDYAEAGATGGSALVVATTNSDWDKASEHAAKAAPYIHPKPAPVQPGARSLSELTTEELEAAAEEARAELAAMQAQAKSALH